MDNKKKVAVIGAGPMGLMTTYDLLKKGYDVTLFERDDRIGGMSASFDFDGTKIERFYHFICKPDQPMFDLLKDFKLQSKLKWRDTSMGLYYDGKLYNWGSPASLLTFPKLGLITKLRYGLLAWTTCRIKDWRKLDKIDVTTWLKKWLGNKGYDALWHKLFHYKFYEYKNDLSAAWLGTRIKRVGLSRKNIFQEEMGYLEGGSDVLLNAMEERINQMGGNIVLKADVNEVVSDNGKTIGVRVNDTVHPFESVVSTIPLPYISKLTPGLSQHTRDQIDAIANVGVACVLFKLKKPLTKHFWVNINDDRIEIPGVIEYSNLNPGAPEQKEKILYVPYYMPSTHAKYKWTDEQFVDEATQYLQMISDQFNSDDIIATKVTRYAFSQTVCGTNFYDKLPPMRSEIDGFYMADTAYYYPEDRSISESVQVGSNLANLVDEDRTETAISQ